MESGQVALQKAMTQAFLESQTRNPAFSLRAFARKLSMSPSAVSEILKGKRRVSREMATRVVESLCMNPKEAKAVLDLFLAGTKDSSQSGQSEGEFLELTMDHFHMVSVWHHFAILSLAETRGFRGDSRTVAARLGLRAAEAQEALERLERLGLLKRTSRGALVASGAQYRTPDGMASVALRKAHADNLEMARLSLEKDALEERDFTSMTMAIDEKKLPVAKRMIREFLGNLSNYLEAGDKNEVYKACFRMFPLSESTQRGT